MSDLPWPRSVEELNPTHTQVMDYIESYAQHFNLLPFIRFGCEVICIDFVGASDQEMESWDLWSGNGGPFSSGGKWQIQVKDKKMCCQEDCIVHPMVVSPQTKGGADFPCGVDASVAELSGNGADSGVVLVLLSLLGGNGAAPGVFVSVADLGGNGALQMLKEGGTLKEDEDVLTGEEGRASK
ncbi:hypothetical protein Vadar_010892 [Vaccinium darrowii]|uniref:Uncharacterized protein n=1 Tax=Vaccinium darrowii TaxID=229202 RepID=A0ACB7YLA9_9ERIC|nr:hypothetical protein Vadar_010892 [Vaccinium darrowii]